MAQAVLFHHGYMVSQKGIPAPKRQTMEAWSKHLWISFQRDLEKIVPNYDRKLLPGVTKTTVEPDRLGIAMGDIAFYVDRRVDALARN